MENWELLHLHNSLEYMPNQHICLMHLGWEQCPSGYSYTNYRNLYLIHFVRSGQGTLSIGKKTYQLKANDLFLIRPNEKAIYTADPVDPWKYYYFAFQGAFAPELIQRTAFHDGSAHFAMSDDRLAEQIIEAADGMETEQPVDIYGLQQLFRFLSTIIGESERYSPAISLTQQYVVKIQQYIHAHYSTPLRVADLAAVLNIDRSYLYRLFTRHVGISPEAYVVRYRLEKGKELLSKTQLPIAQIAGAIGFDNYSSFYKAFLKNDRCSPSEYRRRQMRAEINENDCFVQSTFPQKQRRLADKLKMAVENKDVRE